MSKERPSEAPLHRVSEITVQTGRSPVEVAAQLLGYLIDSRRRGLQGLVVLAVLAGCQSGSTDDGLTGRELEKQGTHIAPYNPYKMDQG